MPRVTTIQDNFTAGELSPRLHGRVSLEEYQAGAELIENCVVLIHGGARRRDGLRYRVAVKDSSKKVRVIPFVFSETQAYVVEVGDQYMRFLKDGVQVAGPYEIATNITESMLFDFDYAQSADTMAITHQSIFPARLRRFADNNWLYDPIPFTVQPFAEIGDSFANTLTLSLATVGAGRTATASGATFLTGDVGRTIYYQGGFATITGYTSATVVTITISAAFASVNIPASVWTLGLSPQDSLTPGVEKPVETSTTLTSPGNVWRTTDVGKYVRMNGGLLLITAYTSPTVVQATIKRELTGVTAAPKNAWSLEASVWSAANGYPRACTFYQQRFVLGGTTAFPQTVWGSVIGAYLDFTLGALDDDAISYTLASDQINPILHLIATKVLHVLTYGGEFTLRGGVEKPLTPTNVQADPQTDYGCTAVRPLRFGKQVLFPERVGAKLRAITYDVDTGDFNAPDLAVLSEHITQPSMVDLAAGKNPDPVIYAPRSDGQVASLSLSEKQSVAAWSRQITDGVVESACTVPSATGDQTYLVVKRTVNGVTKRFIEQFDASMVYSMDSAVVGARTEPNSVNVTNVELVLVSGNAAAGRYERFIHTQFAHNLNIGDAFSVSAMVATKYHDLEGNWVVMGVPTSTVIQITDVDAIGTDGNYVEGGVVTSGAVGTAVWPVAHLEGKEVDCVADGYYMGRFTVTAGNITLPRNALRTVIGLPFSHRVKMLVPEIQTGTGSAQGNAMSTSDVVANFLETYTTDINETTVPFANFGGNLLGQPPRAYTGVKDLETLGWDKGKSDLQLGSSLPFPWHLRFVSRKFTVNG